MIEDFFFLSKKILHNSNKLRNAHGIHVFMIDTIISEFRSILFTLTPPQTMSCNWEKYNYDTELQARD